MTDAGRAMRILVVSMWPSPEAPERGSFVARQVEALRELGHDVEVAPLDDVRTGPLRTPLKYLSLARDARRRLQRFNADVVHAHFLVPTGSVARAVARRAGIPYVVTAHGTDVRNAAASQGRLRRQTSSVAEDAAAVIAVSRQLADELVDVAPGATVHVAHMGVDVSRFDPGRAADDAAAEVGWTHAGPRVLAVGSLLANKNHRRLLQAVARHPDAALALVGAGPMECHLRDHARSLGIDGRVTFAGRVSPDELPTWYSAAHVIALPSLQEGFGLAALEGLAAARAVVVTRAAPVAELVDDSTGVVVDPASVDEIAAGLEHCFALRPPVTAGRQVAERNDVHMCAQATARVLRTAATLPH